MKVVVSGTRVAIDWRSWARVGTGPGCRDEAAERPWAARGSLSCRVAQARAVASKARKTSVNEIRRSAKRQGAYW